MAKQLAYLCFGVLLAGSLAATAADCLPGDLPCFCTSAGGEWRELKSPLKPTCTYKFTQNVNGQGESAGWAGLCAGLRWNEVKMGVAPAETAAACGELERYD